MPPAWHAKATKLRLQGKSYSSIHEILHVSLQSAWDACNPTKAKRRRQRSIAWRSKKYKEDPEFRKREQSRDREAKRRKRQIDPSYSQPRR